MTTQIHDLKTLALQGITNTLETLSYDFLLPVITAVAVIKFMPPVLQWGLSHLIYYWNCEDLAQQEIDEIFGTIDFDNLSDEDYDLYMELVAEVRGKKVSSIQDPSPHTIHFMNKDHEDDFTIELAETYDEGENIKTVYDADPELYEVKGIKA